MSILIKPVCRGGGDAYRVGDVRCTWFKARELAEQSAVPSEAHSRVESWNGAGATQYPITADSVTSAA